MNKANGSVFFLEGPDPVFLEVRILSWNQVFLENMIRIRSISIRIRFSLNVGYWTESEIYFFWAWIRAISGSGSETLVLNTFALLFLRSPFFREKLIFSVVFRSLCFNIFFLSLSLFFIIFFFFSFSHCFISLSPFHLCFIEE